MLCVLLYFIFMIYVPRMDDYVFYLVNGQPVINNNTVLLQIQMSFVLKRNWLILPIVTFLVTSEGHVDYHSPCKVYNCYVLKFARLALLNPLSFFYYIESRKSKSVRVLF